MGGSSQGLVPEVSVLISLDGEAGTTGCVRQVKIVDTVKGTETDKPLLDFSLSVLQFLFKTIEQGHTGVCRTGPSRLVRLPGSRTGRPVRSPSWEDPSRPHYPNVSQKSLFLVCVYVRLCVRPQDWSRLIGDHRAPTVSTICYRPKRNIKGRKVGLNRNRPQRPVYPCFNSGGRPNRRD